MCAGAWHGGPAMCQAVLLTGGRRRQHECAHTVGRHVAWQTHDVPISGVDRDSRRQHGCAANGHASRQSN
eukprot:249890-Alexandrium_andersonii.AAC.1